MKKIGDITEEEKEEIYDIFEKYNSVWNLKKIVSQDDVLYDRLISELRNIEAIQNDWWKKAAQKYNWISESDREWMINFFSNEVYLI